MENLALGGKEAFYKGDISKAIVDVVQQNGGFLTLEDLSQHQSEFVTPISVNYKGVDVYEIVRIAFLSSKS